MVEGETGEYHRSGDGGVMVPKETKTAIDGLDADAATADEQLVVREIKDAFSGRLTHNLQLSIAAITAKNYLMIHGQSQEMSDVAALLHKVPQVAAMRQKDAACFEALEAKLRSRDIQPVTACSTSAMAVPNVEISDVLRAAGQ